MEISALVLGHTWPGLCIGCFAILGVLPSSPQAPSLSQPFLTIQSE